jgi:hypothetical protein
MLLVNPQRPHGPVLLKDLTSKIPEIDQLVTVMEKMITHADQVVKTDLVSTVKLF